MSAFIQCISKSLMLTYMKCCLMQTKTERAFLHLKKKSEGLRKRQKGAKVCKCQEQVGSDKPVVSQEHQVKLPAHHRRGNIRSSCQHKRQHQVKLSTQEATSDQAVSTRGNIRPSCQHKRQHQTKLSAQEATSDQAVSTRGNIRPSCQHKRQHQTKLSAQEASQF